MVQITEKEKTYLIPIENTDPNWVQTQEIPVTYEELNQGSIPLVRLHFPVGPELSPLKILAGGGNLEIASIRIKAQMMHRLEHALTALQKPNPHPTAALEIAQIGQYFSRCD